MRRESLGARRMVGGQAEKGDREMNQRILSVLVVGLIAGSLGAPAEAKRKPKARVAEGSYDNPAVGVPGVVGTSSLGGAVEFVTMAHEGHMSVVVEDSAGGAPFITFSQDSDPSNSTGWEIFATACGETEEPLVIEPGLAVRVSVYTTPGPNEPTCIGPATSGAITATFTK